MIRSVLDSLYNKCDHKIETLGTVLVDPSQLASGTFFQSGYDMCIFQCRHKFCVVFGFCNDNDATDYDTFSTLLASY